MTCKRHGTTDLFAALNVATGEVLHETRKRHTGKDVLEFFRRRSVSRPVSSSYTSAGVDIDVGNRAVALMSEAVASTHTPEVVAGPGGFCGMYSSAGLDAKSVLVASTDGVGTKAELAARYERWRGVGVDLVNHCINDIAVKEDAGALSIARQAGVPTHCLPLSPYLAEDPRPLQRAGCGTAVGDDAVPANGFDIRRAARHRYDADLAEGVAATAPDLVVLAGWMHLLSQVFLYRFPDRVINLHPALPGRFPGTSAIADAWTAFQDGRISTTGVMAQYVPDEGVDNGPVIASVEVPIRPNDTFEALSRRIHEAEHELIVTAIAGVLAERR